jgi:hypothetical protein
MVMTGFSRSLRSLALRPVLSTVVIVTLALGLGVNTAIFSLTREVLLRPLPYRDADRLVRVFEASEVLGRTSAPIAPVNYVAWRDVVDAFEQTAIFRRVGFNVSTTTNAVQLEGFLVGAGFFPMLGVEPALGRGFAEADARPGGDAVVILSDGQLRAHVRRCRPRELRPSQGNGVAGWRIRRFGPDAVGSWRIRRDVLHDLGPYA